MSTIPENSEFIPNLFQNLVFRNGVSEADSQKIAENALKKHPFFDWADARFQFYQDTCLYDNKGELCGILLKNILPESVRHTAANVLRPAAVRSSLRSGMFAGESPFSGIAGYYDYTGTAIHLKHRKSSFTYETEATWHRIFPLIDYVSEIYKTILPDKWQRQNEAIPSVIRIHNSPFSTLTINKKFRTAAHTDSGDFDHGFSCLACLEGNFSGLDLGLTKFNLSFSFQPGDLILFNPHHFHGNTEPETFANSENWSRLSVVFYYRSLLGTPAAFSEFRRRLELTRRNPPPHIPSEKIITHIPETDNGINTALPAKAYVHENPSPFLLLMGVVSMRCYIPLLYLLHNFIISNDQTSEILLFGELLKTKDDLAATPRSSEEYTLKPSLDAVSPSSTISNGGFSTTDQALQAVRGRGDLLSETSLKTLISDELLDSWTSNRSQWMELVSNDWRCSLKPNPNREQLLWKNNSEMNTVFFSLCSCARTVMRALLGHDNPRDSEEQSFWLCFAEHLHSATVKELGMPETAITIKKLNVKIKDFSYGGTRYFRDMPVSEQDRRIERRRRLEETKANPHFQAISDPSLASRPQWVDNDYFDYQTEDREVDYDSLNILKPKEFINSLSQLTYLKNTKSHVDPSLMELIQRHPNTKNKLLSSGVGAQKSSKSTKFMSPNVLNSSSYPFNDPPCRVLIILPTPTDDKKCYPTEEVLQCPFSDGQHEWDRIIGSPGAKKMLQECIQFHGKITLPEKVCHDNLIIESIHYSVADIDHLINHRKVHDSVSSSYHFVILQHILSSISDDGYSFENFSHENGNKTPKYGRVRSFIDYWRGISQVGIFILETDLMDRHFFLLQPHIRKQYDQVAQLAYQILHRAKYRIPEPIIRSRHCFREILGDSLTMTFLFENSIFNTLGFFLAS